MTKKKERYDLICLELTGGSLSFDLSNVSYSLVNSDNSDDEIEMTQEDIENLKDSQSFKEVLWVLEDFFAQFASDSFDVSYVYLKRKKNRKGERVVDIDYIDCYDGEYCSYYDKEDIEEMLYG